MTKRAKKLKINKTLANQGALLARLEIALTRPFVDQSRAQTFKHEYLIYPFIPYHDFSNYPVLKSIKDKFFTNVKRPSFIDVGCGIGNKMVLAAMAGFQSFGVELRPNEVKLARQIAHTSFGNVKQKDAFDLDYSEYDLIYMFNPIADFDLMRKLTLQISRQMKVKLISPNSRCPGGFLLVRYNFW